MNRSEIIDVFKETGALLDGHFILTSGRHSFSYFQCARVLQHPEYLTHFAEMIAKHFNKEKIDAVISPISSYFSTCHHTGRFPQISF